MIPYIEVLNNNLKKFALIEPKECWFELSYYENGEFQIYARASKENLNALQKGNFVMIPNKRFIWFITAIKYTYNVEGARMISATGYEAKWLLNKRIIYTPKELKGTITSEVYNLVSSNLGVEAVFTRRINGFIVDTNSLLIDISGTQAPRGNLGEFVNTLLKTYNCGSQIIYENGNLKYTILNGNVKTGSVKFSQSFDNLLSSEYLSDDEELKTNALVVSKVDEIDYTYVYDMGATGLDRSEMLVNSNLSTKYEDANGVEQELDLTKQNDKNTFANLQLEEAKNELAKNKTIEEINGELDLNNSIYEFDKDYFIGDLVQVKDEYFNYSYNVRILKYTIKQDSNGYAELAEYGGQ